MEKHPREVHAPATRSRPALRTDNIDTIIYGRDGHGLLSSIEFPAVERIDVGKGRFYVGKRRFDVGSGGLGHVKSRVQDIETHEIKKDGNFTLADHGTKMHDIKENGSVALADHGSAIKKNGSFTSAHHDHETSKSKMSDSLKFADHGSSTACDDTSEANRHIGEADNASKHTKRSQAVQVV